LHATALIKEVAGVLKHRVPVRILLVVLLVAALAMPAAAQTTVQVSGWGGTDTPSSKS